MFEEDLTHNRRLAKRFSTMAAVELFRRKRLPLGTHIQLHLKKPTVRSSPDCALTVQLRPSDLQALGVDRLQQQLHRTTRGTGHHPAVFVEAQKAVAAVPSHSQLQDGQFRRCGEGR